MPSSSRDPKIAAIGTLRQEECCGRFEPSPAPWHSAGAVPRVLLTKASAGWMLWTPHPGPKPGHPAIQQAGWLGSRLATAGNRQTEPKLSPASKPGGGVGVASRAGLRSRMQLPLADSISARSHRQISPPPPRAVITTPTLAWGGPHSPVARLAARDAPSPSRQHGSKGAISAAWQTMGVTHCPLSGGRPCQTGGNDILFWLRPKMIWRRGQLKKTLTVNQSVGQARKQTKTPSFCFLLVVSLASCGGEVTFCQNKLQSNGNAAGRTLVRRAVRIPLGRLPAASLLSGNGTADLSVGGWLHYHSTGACFDGHYSPHCSKPYDEKLLTSPPPPQKKECQGIEASQSKNPLGDWRLEKSIVLLDKIVIFPKIGHQISCLGVCCANDPKQKRGVCDPCLRSI